MTGRRGSQGRKAACREGEMDPEPGALLDLISPETARRLVVFPLCRSPTTMAVVTPEPLDAVSVSSPPPNPL